MLPNRFTFTVEFDFEAWSSLDVAGQADWLNRVEDAISRAVASCVNQD